MGRGLLACICVAVLLVPAAAAAPFAATFSASCPLGTLYDPMYFTGGYAIHGNPSVPMWIAPSLYSSNDYSEIVYVY